MAKRKIYNTEGQNINEPGIDDFTFEDDDDFSFEDIPEESTGYTVEPEPEVDAIRNQKKQGKQKKKKKKVESKYQRQKINLHQIPLTKILSIIGCIGLGIGILWSLISPTMQGNSLVDRVESQEDKAIKQATDTIENDTKAILNELPVSKLELRDNLIRLGHTNAQAQELISKITTDQYDEEGIISKRIDLYLEATGFSEKGLAGRLVADGFDREKVLAVLAKRTDINYIKEAQKRGATYLEDHVVKKDAMIKALLEDGFTQETIDKSITGIACD